MANSTIKSVVAQVEAKTPTSLSTFEKLHTAISRASAQDADGLLDAKHFRTRLSVKIGEKTLVTLSRDPSDKDAIYFIGLKKTFILFDKKKGNVRISGHGGEKGRYVLAEYNTGRAQLVDVWSTDMYAQALNKTIESTLK